eukprot:TRINITY_DN19025_c0_g1_i2.p1 TRINITY_DN19025_c0_g1~~TRINITY_DN19025_c0_g1_i2.p1  ORF type:complete len:324 (+),score=43.72 TRINITY_DN19025_c0_g1_i2:84-1055(+)
MGHYARDGCIARSARRLRNAVHGSAASSDGVLAPAAMMLEDVTAIACYSARAAGAQAKIFDDSVIALPPEERARAIATYMSSNTEALMSVQGRCGKCMFQHAYCICSKLASLRERLDGLRTGDRIRFVLWLHHKERVRASNTGKLLEHLLPGSELLTFDVSADEERFQELLNWHKGRACVLYPSDEAITPEQLVEVLGLPTSAAHNASSGPAVAANTRPLLVVLIDGTWRQAKRMQRHMEGLPKVILQPKKLSQFHWRRQSREDRICTVEAAALLLDDLREPGTVSDAIGEALSILNESLTRQCHYDTFPDGPAAPQGTGTCA